MGKLFAFEEQEVEVVEVADNEIDEQVVEAGELQEEVSSIDEGVVAVNDGEEAGDQLAEVADVIEQTVEQGEGLDPVAAEAIRIAVEAICTRVGASTKNMYPLYATENFHSKASRVANSKIALESIGETIKNIWEKIVAFLKRLVAKVTGFWKKLAFNVQGTQKAIAELLKKVEKLEGNADSKDKTIVAPNSLISAVATDDVVTKGGVAEFAKAAGTVSKALDLLAKIVPMAEKAPSASNNFDEVVYMPFGKKLHVSAIRAEEEGSPNVITVEMGDAGLTLPDAMELAVLSKAEMKQLLKDTSTFLVTVTNNGKIANDLFKALEKAEANMKLELAKLGKGEEEKADAMKQYMVKVKEAKAKVVGAIGSVTPSVNVVAVRFSRAVMTYVKLSMAKYK